MAFLVVSLLALAAGTFSGIVGTGSSLVLMPALVLCYGPKQAVPIMAVAAVLGNFSRIAAWRREVDWRIWTAYSLPAVPAAVLGARTLLVLPGRLVEGGLGLFFLAMIPATRWLAKREWKPRLWHLALGGAAIGYLTGIVVTTGPINVPLFLACGLVKGAFLATEAACSLAVYVGKVGAFREFGALPPSAVAQGCAVGAFLMVGQFIARPYVRKMEPQTYRLLLDGLMLVSGTILLGVALLRR